MLETTLVIIKPDGVVRGLATTILSRFERVGLKLIAAKMTLATADQAKQHYLYEDIATRHSEAIWHQLIDYLTESPIVATAFTGIGAIEIARKLTGPTEPRKAPPGTIRGDYCHQSYAVCDQSGKAVRNVIHASADAADANRELRVWFSEKEVCQYRKADDFEHFLGVDVT